jgi:lysophospholipase
MADEHLPEPDAWLRRHRLPDAARQSFLPMADGWPVRVVNLPQRDKGHILILTGRADFVEKYAELLHDLADAGWGATIFDWRGQGLSRRVGKTPQHGASPGFNIWLRDLGTMIDWATNNSDGPLLAMAHSMGGHLLLRHLAAGGGRIARAVLLAPMIGLKVQPLGAGLGRLVAGMQVVRGKGDDFVWGGGPWQQGRAGEQRQRWLTSDLERFSDESWWVGTYPALALGSVTWGWLDEAFASIAALTAPGLAEGISTPLQFQIPARDGLVDSAATRRFAARIPGAQLLDYPQGAHELLREADPLRGQVLAAAMAFLDTISLP